jgi:hypothetical protein
MSIFALPGLSRLSHRDVTKISLKLAGFPRLQLWQDFAVAARVQVHTSA